MRKPNAAMRNTMSNPFRQLLFALPTVLLVAPCLMSCASQGATQEPSSPANTAAATSDNQAGSSTTNPASGTSGAVKSFPNFSLEDLSGKTVSLSDYVGNKVVLLDFWATWCEPCLAAMPHFNELYDKYKDDGFMLLSVSVDGPESVADVRAFVHRQGIKYPVLLDQESRAVSLYNPKGSVPFSVLFAKDGTILHKRDTIQPGDEASIDKEVAEALRR